MASKSSKRKSPSSENDEKSPNSKCQKTKNGPIPTTSNSNKSEVATDSVLNFLKDIFVYILPASIEKTRMHIFKTQLTKYGGVVVDKFHQDRLPTHLIVDEKMEIDRMCRLLKLDKAPSNIRIVKTGWLSACFKSKTFVDLAGFEIICPNETPNVEDGKTNTEDHSVKSKNEVLSKNETNVQSSSKDVSCSKTQITNPENDEGKNKMFPKVGVMFGAFKRANAAEADGEESGDSDYIPSDKEDGPEGDNSDSYSSGDEVEATSDFRGNVSCQQNTSSVTKLPRGHWVCAQSSKTLKPNYNKHITDKLEEMVKTYQSTNDRWRALGYQKAIQAIRKHPKQISTWEEAKSLPGVGARLADKVWEIAESGELRKLNEFKSSEELQVISLFTDVWGAGAHTARTWYQQGFRSLEDLKTKANLTKQQKIGLQHYHDFLNRMPRSEVEDILTTVGNVAEELVPATRCEVCGSYRRGKPTCGDIDILITHPDGKSHRGIFAKLLGRLREEGFLTDDLVSGEENGNQKKYMGVFRLKGHDRKHRRIDIIVTPVEEYACALVHFTGSAHFNRSIRHLAKKMNMSLSEHALRTGVVRKGGEKLFEGTALPTPTEESVFKHMGIPYRPPDERDH